MLGGAAATGGAGRQATAGLKTNLNLHFEITRWLIAPFLPYNAAGSNVFRSQVVFSCV